MKHPWQYNETVQVGTDYGSAEEVAVYDERMARLRDPAAEAADIREALSLAADATVWEIGTGTGECALALAPVVRRVYASDVSCAMLEYARNKAKKRGVENVVFVEGGFLSGFRPDEPVDGIVTQLALHHLPDFWKWRALTAMAEVLRPGGRLFLRDVVFSSDIPDYDAYFTSVTGWMREGAGARMAEDTARHIREEFSTLDWILEGMLERAGLRMVDRRSEGFLTVYVCEKPQDTNGEKEVADNG